MNMNKTSYIIITAIITIILGINYHQIMKVNNTLQQIQYHYDNAEKYPTLKNREVQWQIIDSLQNTLK